MKRHHDDYDYEEAYNRQCENLEEIESCRFNINQIKGMAYRTTTTEAGKMLEIDIYPTFGIRHDMPRTVKRRESRPSQKSLNDKRARRYLNQLASANFGKGDIWATFTYRAGEEPRSVEDAEKNFGNFIRRINRRRKKAGKKNIKYIYVTEWEDGEKGIRCHHHAIMSGDVNRDEIEELWHHGDRTETKRLAPDPDTHITGLVHYITKDSRGKKRWKTSKGLVKPKITRSYSKFRKNTVRKMVIDRSMIEAELKKKYKNARFVDADVYISDVNGGYYIYARMVRD